MQVKLRMAQNTINAIPDRRGIVVRVLAFLDGLLVSVNPSFATNFEVRQVHF